jgi:hypothetical protein
MPAENRRPDEIDDDDEFCIRKRDAGGGRLLMWLALGAIAVALTLCLTGAGYLIHLSSASDELAAKLPGSWRGRFDFGGQGIDAIYVFEKNGEFRQETINPPGRPVGGRWRVVLGKVIIDWDNGGFEQAVVTWPNDQTMDWHIVNHSDAIQIGSITTMRRQQAVLPKRR